MRRTHWGILALGSLAPDGVAAWRILDVRGGPGPLARRMVLVR